MAGGDVNDTSVAIVLVGIFVGIFWLALGIVLGAWIW